jgi:peroxiredoxin
MAIVLAAPATTHGADPQAPPPPPAPQVAHNAPADPRWLERLDALDRALLEELVGYAPPEFAAELTWVDAERRTWADLRGRVVVLQSWTSRTTAGRKVPGRVARQLADFARDDVEIILLHTPDGRDTIQTFLDRRPIEQPLVVDPRGAFCDRLGVYKRPVNIVVDRNGVTRYAGLGASGLAPAVAGLVAEAHDPGAAPPVRAAPETPAAEFPPVTGAIDKAIDFRGRRAPDFTVGEWWTDRPDATGKVVILDFWATWCGPCIAAIPHMNDLADRFRADVCVVGISREAASKFDEGMERIGRMHEFRYALAVDSAGTMQQAVGITAIPHCLVIGRDWTVRWQGHPSRLTAEIVEQIVKADAGGAPGVDPRRFRWTDGS